MPMPVHFPDTSNYRWLQKKVIESRILDSMEDLARWSVENTGEGRGQAARISERAVHGKHSIRLRARTMSDKAGGTMGRPPGSASLIRSFDGEDWSRFNRVSFWVYPDLPGFRVVSLLLVLHNDGVEKIPNAYLREGLDYVILRNHQWNQVVSEIAHLARDKVTSVEFRYRLQGSETGDRNSSVRHRSAGTRTRPPRLFRRLGCGAG
jgi:hypothetical protein